MRALILRKAATKGAYDRGGREGRMGRHEICGSRPMPEMRFLIRWPDGAAAHDPSAQNLSGEALPRAATRRRWW
jgi:hypothetical protein